MKTLLLILFSLVLIGSGISARAQSAEKNGITESVHVHLSETVVGAGESIWFQAIITDVDSSADLSQVLYLDLISQQQVSVVRGIYQAKEGVATGQLSLPDTLSGGWYQLRAYTQYMRNGSAANFFAQPVLIVNANQTNLVAQPNTITKDSPINYALFPEGGNWVANEKMRGVAYANLPASEAEIKLEIIRLEDSSAVFTKSIQYGLATFEFTPQSEVEYLARFIARDTTYTEIPQPSPNGYTLQADVRKSDLQIYATSKAKDEDLTLIVRLNQQLLYQQSYNESSLSASVPLNSAQGVLEVSLIDGRGNTLAQRMVYVPPSSIDLSLSVPNSTVSPRGPVSISLSPASSELLTDATLSVAVRKIHSVVEHPLSVTTLEEYGLAALPLPSAVIASKEQAVRWVNQWLITQSSPWPTWSGISSKTNVQASFTKEDDFLLVTGKVRTAMVPNEEDQVLLSIPGDSPYFEYSEVSSDGSFAVPISRVTGTQSIILQYRSATSDQPKELEWELNKPFAPTKLLDLPEPILLSDQAWQELKDGYRLRQRIQQAYYSVPPPEEPATDTRNQFRFYGAPNVRIDPDDYISLPSFEEICRELLPGVRLMKRKGKYDFDVFDPGSRSFLPNEPTIFLDGVPIQDINYLIDFPPEKIAWIETVNRHTYYGNVRLDGVIAVYTEEGNAYEVALSGQSETATLPFYTESKSFSTLDSLSTTLPDFRTLLYWHPRITVGADEKTDITFTTADELGLFEVEVRGNTNQGEIVYGRITFEVKTPALP